MENLCIFLLENIGTPLYNIFINLFSFRTLKIPYRLPLDILDFSLANVRMMPQRDRQEKKTTKGNKPMTCEEMSGGRKSQLSL